MKKAIILASALTLLASFPASAQIIIQPTFIAPPLVLVAPVPAYIVEPATYPVHIDHHHHYDWRYWREHGEHEHR